MDKLKQKRQKYCRRQKRVRAKVKGIKDQPRLSVFRSNQHIYAQLIDDQQGKTLAAAADSEIKKKGLTKTELAREIGLLLAKKALAQKIAKAVFDRGAYRYHGRVKALAEGARQGGLKF